MIRQPALVVRLRRSGRTLTVPAELTVLEALERAGIEIPSLCRAGICGTCETVAVAEPPRVIRLCVTTAGPDSQLTLDL
ncbi:2Fe-2S iron-sulfur cluster-binding protein [Nocardia brasiliensis]|uniref:2Fe-2S iron-sulfur cluster-binding protein n=1 Tax=Nocardia brasiliensis TaxID=37326 RepID=UPI002453EB7A|nr:2Fe-2S iron-sulfur cluster binding domain-containing protein [Nocardia brasiliensis]